MKANLFNSTLLGCGLALALTLAPVRAAEVLFDNGKAIDYAGMIGGAGYSTNELTAWRVYDNFSFDRDLSIESVWFQMAGGAEPFTFSVYEDDRGQPGKEIFNVKLDVGDYEYGNFRWYKNGSFFPDPGYDFSFDLDQPLTLAPGKYWVSFWGTGSSQFYTLGTGPGDGLRQKHLTRKLMLFRRGNTPFRLIGQPVDAMTVEIDIKPGSDKNPVNPKSKGVIPVAVLGSPEFDAMQVDASTVLFGPGEAKPAHDGHVEDVDGDGYPDMVFHFRTRETGIACGDSVAYLSGETFGGEGFTSSDTIEVEGCDDLVAPDAVTDDAPPDEIVDETNEEFSADGGSGSDAAAVDWSVLLGMGVLMLLALRRSGSADLRPAKKRIDNRHPGVGPRDHR